MERRATSPSSLATTHPEHSEALRAQGVRRPSGRSESEFVADAPWIQCTLVHRMEAEWDPAKARANLRKHSVRFADAVTALEDARAITVRDEGADEERWISIGMDSLGPILVVVLPGAMNGLG